MKCTLAVPSMKVERRQACDARQGREIRRIIQVHHEVCHDSADGLMIEGSRIGLHGVRICELTGGGA